VGQDSALNSRVQQHIHDNPIAGHSRLQNTLQR